MQRCDRIDNRDFRERTDCSSLLSLLVFLGTLSSPYYQSLTPVHKFFSYSCSPFTFFRNIYLTFHHLGRPCLFHMKALSFTALWSPSRGSQNFQCYDSPRSVCVDLISRFPPPCIHTCFRCRLLSDPTSLPHMSGSGTPRHAPCLQSTCLDTWP